jgi:hypothetical protein
MLLKVKGGVNPKLFICLPEQACYEIGKRIKLCRSVNTGRRELW